MSVSEQRRDVFGQMRAGVDIPGIRQAADEHEGDLGPEERPVTCPLDMVAPISGTSSVLRRQDLRP